MFPQISRIWDWKTEVLSDNIPTYNPSKWMAEQEHLQTDEHSSTEHL